MAQSMAASVNLGLPVVERDLLRHIIKSSTQFEPLNNATA